MSARCYGEMMAHAAAGGYASPEAADSARRRRRNTLADAAADGARGDPATGHGERDETSAVLHETKTASANPFPRRAVSRLSCAVGSATGERVPHPLS